MNEDILEDHLRKAKSFTSMFYDLDNPSTQDKERITKDLVLGIHSEATSLIEAINWKTHHLLRNDISRSKILEEIIDIYKYTLSVCATWGFSQEDLLHEFARKDLINWQRYEQEKIINRIPELEKVCVIDIDGVLANYPENILVMSNDYFNTTVKIDDITSLHNVDVEYEKHGVAIEDYRRKKSQFEEEGLYGVNSTNLPLPGAVDFMMTLKKQGYTILLLSGRPYRLKPRIFADTVEWLKFWKIPFDALLWEKDKDVKVLSELSNIQFLLDDDPETTESLGKAGIHTFLMKRPYNRDSYPYSRLANYDDVLAFINQAREPMLKV